MLIHWYRVSNWLWRHGVPVLPKLMWKLQYLSDADFKEMNKPKTRGDNPFPETPELVK